MNLDTWGKTKWQGLKGKSGPPGNMNGFQHGLADIQKRSKEGSLRSMRRMSGSKFDSAEKPNWYLVIFKK